MDSNGKIAFHIEIDSSDLESLIEKTLRRVLAEGESSARLADRLNAQLFYTEHQAAALLGLTTIALREERLKGRIDYVQRGRQVKYLPEHLSAYVSTWADRSVEE